jgi:hypothetical protein
MDTSLLSQLKLSTALALMQLTNQLLHESMQLKVAQLITR